MRLICLITLSFFFSASANAAMQELDPNSQRSYLAQMRAAMTQHQFKEIDVDFQHMDLDHVRYTNGRYFGDAVTEMLSTDVAENPGALMPLLDEWAQVMPDSYVPLLLRGASFKKQAWREIRVSSLSEAAAKKFKDYHDRAKPDLERAYKLNPHSALAAIEMIGLHKVMQNNQQAEEWFRRAIAADPESWAAYKEYLYVLEPHWGGSDELMLDFAHKAVQEHASNPVFGMVLIEAHRAIAMEWVNSGKSAEDYYSKPEVWNDLNGALKKMLAAYHNAKGDRDRLAYYSSMSGYGGGSPRKSRT